MTPRKIKKILFVTIPSREKHLPYFPYGIAMIAAVTRKAGFEVEVLDICGHRYTYEEIREKIRHTNADFIAISALITYFRYLRQELLPIIREERPDIPVAVGGSGPSSAPKIFLENLPIDYCVMGEGEIPFVELLEALNAEKDLRLVGGIAFKQNGQVIINSAGREPANLDELPMAAYDLFDIKKCYLHAGHDAKQTSFTFYASRGCPYGCKFCYRLSKRGKIRYRSVESLIEEILYVKKLYPFKEFHMGDENMAVNKEWFFSFCDALSKKVKLPWAFAGYFGLIDKKKILAAKKSGCRGISFGIESGSQRILNILHKGTKIPHNRAVARLCMQTFGFVGGGFIFGNPGENEESIRETKEFCKDLLLTPQFFSLQPYPGTDIYQQCVQKGLIPNEVELIESLDEAKKFSINLTDWSTEDFIRIKQETEEELRRYFWTLPFKQKIKGIYKNYGWYWGTRKILSFSFYLIPYFQRFGMKAVLQKLRKVWLPGASEYAKSSVNLSC